jgi:hypothetical protein
MTYVPTTVGVKVAVVKPVEYAAGVPSTAVVVVISVDVATVPAFTLVPPAAVSTGSATLVAGELVTDAVTVIASVSAVAMNDWFSTTETAVPAVVVDVAADAVKVSAWCAVAETAENEPSVKAATATSAMRLKVVFVDICFLSIVDLENLPSSA